MGQCVCGSNGPEPGPAVPSNSRGNVAKTTAPGVVPYEEVVNSSGHNAPPGLATPPEMLFLVGLQAEHSSGEPALPEIVAPEPVAVSSREDGGGEAGGGAAGSGGNSAADGVNVGPQASVDAQLSTPALEADLLAHTGEQAITSLAGIAEQPSELAAEGEFSVTEVVDKAAVLMQDFLLLEAEELLAKTAHRLSVQGYTDALRELEESSVYKNVSQRIAKYNEVCGSLHDLSSSFSLVWTDDSAELWVSKAGSRTGFEYRIIVDIEAPLVDCMAPGHEIDYVPVAQPMVSKTPTLYAFHRFYLVMLSVIRVPLFKVELLFEVFRVLNTEFGFLAETVTSNFSTEDLNIPKCDWATVRPRTETTCLWMPRGGKKSGTVLVQACRVDVGFSVPQSILKFLFEKLAPQYVRDLRKSAAKASEPDSPWQARIKADADGLYRDLAKVETAAKLRQEISVTSLPGKDVFRREWPLPPR